MVLLPACVLSHIHVLRPRQGDDDAEAAAEGASSLAFAACSPVQIVANGDVRIGHFDVTRFAKTVGDFAKVCMVPGRPYTTGGGGRSCHAPP